jgi:hypothetical protein
MKKKRSTKSKSARSLRELPAKAVRRKTADGVKGGYGTLGGEPARRLQATAVKGVSGGGTLGGTVHGGWDTLANKKF